MGFLPSYNKDTGNITAFADYGTDTFYRRFSFELRRSSIIALSEYAPGNLIYANSGKYRNSYFHLSLNMEGSAQEESALQPDSFMFDLESERIFEKGVARTGYVQDGLQSIDAIKICDLDLSFLSLVSDDENYRFRMNSKILGYEKNIHRGGAVWRVHNVEFHHLRGLEICLACGQTRSPFASEAELTNFVTSHKERICHHTPQWYGLLTDAQVDGLIFKGFSSKSDAVNFCESIIMGASGLLEMNRDDLNILILPQSLEDYDVLLFDPMIGGSGLLDQIIERWKEIIAIGLHALNCPNQCKLSCYRCLRTYRNMPFHNLFDRNRALELITGVNMNVVFSHDVPSTKVHEQTQGPGVSTNNSEHILREKLREHGFPEFEAQKQVAINLPKIKFTYPDLYYEDPSRDIKIAIYLDGLSKTIHGDADRKKMDKIIRSALRIKKVEVVEIAASELNDSIALDLYFQEIASYLDS